MLHYTNHLWLKKILSDLQQWQEDSENVVSFSFTGHNTIFEFSMLSLRLKPSERMFKTLQQCSGSSIFLKMKMKNKGIYNDNNMHLKTLI